MVDVEGGAPLGANNVAYWHITDISPMDGDFRLWGYNGHQNRGSRLPELTQIGGHCHWKVFRAEFCFWPCTFGEGRLIPSNHL